MTLVAFTADRHAARCSPPLCRSVSPARGRPAANPLHAAASEMTMGHTFWPVTHVTHQSIEQWPATHDYPRVMTPDYCSFQPGPLSGSALKIKHHHCHKTACSWNLVNLIMGQRVTSTDPWPTQIIDPLDPWPAVVSVLHMSIDGTDRWKDARPLHRPVSSVNERLNIVILLSVNVTILSASLAASRPTFV